MLTEISSNSSKDRQGGKNDDGLRGRGGAGGGRGHNGMRMARTGTRNYNRRMVPVAGKDRSWPGGDVV